MRVERVAYARIREGERAGGSCGAKYPFSSMFRYTQMDTNVQISSRDKLDDMAGRVCLITGASGGLGKATALGLARLGACVVMACRDVGRGEADHAEIVAASGNSAVTLMALDLASQQSVRQMAASFEAEHARRGGIWRSPQGRRSNGHGRSYLLRARDTRRLAPVSVALCL
jgi:hypothetical protein